MWDQEFLEPTRQEVISMKSIWLRTFSSRGVLALSSEEVQTLQNMIQKYPYLAEPNVSLAASMKSGMTVMVCDFMLCFVLSYI